MKINDAKLSFGGKLTPLDLKVINGIVFHHMAHTSWGVKEVHDFHRYKRGWYGIGYNYFIDFDGNVYKGRELNQGAHASGENTEKIGIGFQGNFETQQMTDAQVKAGKELVEWLHGKLGRKVKLYQHKDVGVTACAGKNFRMSDMKSSPSKPKGGDRVLLKRGSSGQNVKQLQEDLLSLGYSLPKFGADGAYGNETETAVKQFQRDEGITVDGIAGPDTFGKIEAAQQADDVLYRVQVGAFRNKNNADNLEKQLQKAGFDTYMVKQ